MTTNRYWTAQQVIDQTAIESGLAAPGSGVYASTDANAILLRNLLNTAGQELAAMYEWPSLVKETTITSTGAGSYSPPADFGGFVDETQWDRTQVYPMAPISPQDWQMYEAISTSSTWNDIRLVRDLIKITPDSNVGATIAYEYRSRYWARATATPVASGPDKSAPTASTDLIYFEPMLIVSLLKLRYQQARGFDTTGALMEFERRYDSAVSAQTVATTLNLRGG